MVDSKARGDATVQVWWSSLTAADRRLLALLSTTERSRVEALQRPADQGRSLVAAALLRVAVEAHSGVPAREVVVDRTCDDCGGPHGRPRVVGVGERAPHVSVSHSGVLVVVALSASSPLGVDVQRVADMTGPAEGGPGADEWVRREAVLKAGGDPARLAVRGLRAPLDGYAAALATRTARAPTDAEVVVRHWPTTSG